MISLRLAITSILAVAAAPPALASVGGHCTDSWGANCICLDRQDCINRGGDPQPGGPGTYPCPWDPDNVQGCFINNCKGSNTVCQWSDFCSHHGTVLPDPVCPGDNSFVCCSY